MTVQTGGVAVDRIGDSLRSAAAWLQDGSLHVRPFGQLAQRLISEDVCRVLEQVAVRHDHQLA